MLLPAVSKAFTLSSTLSLVKYKLLEPSVRLSVVLVANLVSKAEFTLASV